MTRLPPSFLRRPIAHRGLHAVAEGRPENSRVAIVAAIAGGFGIEIDLQLSRDDQAMVFHDYALDRLTGQTGAVRQHRAEDLHRIPLLGGDETIPDLPQILELVAGRVPLLIELKDQDGAIGPDLGPLEHATAEAINGYDGPLAVMSFNPHSVIEMARLAPKVPRGLVTSSYDPADWPLSVETCQRLRDIPDFDRAGASFISHEVDDLTRPRVAELAASGADILCWTVRSAQVAARALEIADNITFEGYDPS